MKSGISITILTGVMISILNVLAAAGGERPDGLYAKMDTTKGMIVVRFFYKETPMTVGNFVGLAEGALTWRDPSGGEKKSKYFDGLIFHRVVPDFVIQGGDPLGRGYGGPGYQFPDEFHPSLRHDKAGILSMANAGPGTNGSQFFITHGPTPHLDNRHAVFGEVVEGMDVVYKIVQGDKIKSIVIERIGADAKAYDAAKAFQDKSGVKL